MIGEVKLPQRQVDDQRAQENFEAIEKLLTSTVLHASSAATETGVVSTDYTYTAAQVVLKQGTWRVDGWATMYSTTATDQKLLALWNQTTGAEVPNSRSGAEGATAVSVAQNFATSTVLSVTSDTTVRLRGIRNGATIVNFGGGTGVLSIQRLMATRIQ